MGVESSICEKLHSKKVTVWAAMSNQGIIRPLFFEDNEMMEVVNL